MDNKWVSEAPEILAAKAREHASRAKSASIESEEYRIALSERKIYLVKLYTVLTQRKHVEISNESLNQYLDEYLDAMGMGVADYTSESERYKKEADQYSPETEEHERAIAKHKISIVKRQILLTKLYELVNKYLYQVDPRAISNSNQYSSQFAEVKKIAHQLTWLKVCKEAPKYNVDRGGFRNFCFSHCLNSKHRSAEAAKELIGHPSSVKVWSSDFREDDSGKSLLDSSLQPSVEPSPSLEILEIIQLDPDKLFEKKCYNNNPKANFKAIVQLRIVKEFKWEKIAQEVGLDKNKYAPLSTFYQRCCQEFKSKIKEYLDYQQKDGDSSV